MTLALFDLDNTLLDGDSDQLWTEFLGLSGVLDLHLHGPRLLSYHEQYLAGALDVHEYLDFSIGLIRHLPVTELRELRDAFMIRLICPRIRDQARALVEGHRARGDRLIMVTLTNRFISEPIAREFGIEALLATEPEIVSGYLTGRILGEPCYQHGKIAHLQRWMDQHEESFDGSCFYSDSINDLPLLEAVDCPIVVNPDPDLAAIARQRGWLCRQLFEARQALR